MLAMEKDAKKDLVDFLLAKSISSTETDFGRGYISGAVWSSFIG